MLLPFILLWLAIGAAVGFIFSKVLNLRGDDPIGGIGVAAIGGAVVALICNLYSGHGLAGWKTWSCGFAAIGGTVAAIVWHIVRSRFVSHASYTTRRSH